MEGAIRPKDSEPERTMLPTYLRTNERSEQGRELKRKRVQIGRPEGQAAAARAVAGLGREVGAFSSPVL